MTTHLIPAIAWGRLEIACVAGRMADKGRNDPKWEWSRTDSHATVGEGPVCKRCVKVVQAVMADQARMLARFGIEGGADHA